MRRRLLPSVVPKPRSRGSQVNLPYVCVNDSGSTSSVRGRIKSRQLRAMNGFCRWVVGAAEKRRGIDVVAGDAEVAVTRELARLGVIGGKTEPVDHVVEAPFDELEQVLARDTLHPDRLVVVAAELPLGKAVHALDL